MRQLLLLLLCGCGLDSFNADKGVDPDNPGIDSGLHSLDSGDDGNRQPRAHAGPDQTLTVGDVAQLDGSVSFDPDDDTLSYQWSVEDAPQDSNTNLNKPKQVTTSLRLDVVGSYEVSLEVSDGAKSDIDTLVLTATETNSLPVADAGSDQSVPIGATVQLDGTNSWDPDDEVLNYSWRFKSKPNGSAASLSTPTDGFASFVADLEGNYLIELIVDDGEDISDPDTVKVSAVSGSSDGSGCGCGERAKREIKNRPWLFGIALAPQGLATSLLFGVWATRRRRSSEEKTENSDSEQS